MIRVIMERRLILFSARKRATKPQTAKGRASIRDKGVIKDLVKELHLLDR